MARPKIVLDRAGMRAMLSSPEVASAIAGLAQTVAGNVDNVTSDGTVMPVRTDAYTTDRAAVAVTIAHPAGLPSQAKHGTLTRAASAAGLEVRER